MAVLNTYFVLNQNNQQGQIDNNQAQQECVYIWDQPKGMR